MEDETSMLVKPPEVTSTTTTTRSNSGDSRVLNVSVRGWLAVLAIATVCTMGIMQLEVKEPLYTLSVAIVSFYYGQKKHV